MVSFIRYLVPSGKEDGTARELREDDEDDDPVHVFGQVVDAVIRNGRVEARVMPGINSSPLDRWRQMKSSRQMQRVADEAAQIAAETAAQTAAQTAALAEAVKACCSQLHTTTARTSAPSSWRVLAWACAMASITPRRTTIKPTASPSSATSTAPQSAGKTQTGRAAMGTARASAAGESGTPAIIGTWRAVTHPSRPSRVGWSETAMASHLCRR